MLKRKNIKLALILPLAMCSSLNGMAKGWEPALVVHSGLFHFSGAAASKGAIVSYDDVGQSSTDNPYGAQSAVCYGFGYKTKKSFQKHLIYGTEISLEILRSTTPIIGTTGSGASPKPPIITPADGTSKLNLFFLNLEPFIGYRLKPAKHITIDLEAGLDVAFNFTSMESRTIRGYKDNKSWGMTPTGSQLDMRPRVLVEARYKWFGVFAGYSLGLSNYAARRYFSYVGMSERECYSRLIRFGLTFGIR